MRLQASKFDHLPFLLPKTTSAAITSIIFEPSSRSLALFLSDSSALLHSRLPLPFLSTPSKSPTVVPPISTAACFLHLLPSASVLFLSTSPLASGSSIQLRAWTLAPNASSFTLARLNFKKQLARQTVSLDLRHGFSVRIAGSVNFFVIHSLAESQIWVMSAKHVAGDVTTVELMKCAVIELTFPIYSITLTMGFLLLGELNGIRVFPLRPLVKGGKVKKSSFGKKRINPAIDLCKKNLPNGVTCHKINVDKTLALESACSCSTVGGCAMVGVIERKADDCRAPCKLRTLRIKQNDQFSFFVSTRDEEPQISEMNMGPLPSTKAVSIHLLSKKRFLVLDSAGDMHAFSLHDTGVSPQTTAQFSVKYNVYQRHVSHTMEVQMLAVRPDNSASELSITRSFILYMGFLFYLLYAKFLHSVDTQVVWISDGSYSMHLMLFTDIESPINDTEKDVSSEMEFTISAVEAVFMSEKIQEIISVSANSVLVLCQGSIFLYVVAWS